MCLRAKNITRLSPLGVSKKNKMGSRWAMCHTPNKNEEDGLQKKSWGNAHLFEVNCWRPSFAYP